jgi:hypothetical protein
MSLIIVEESYKKGQTFYQTNSYNRDGGSITFSFFLFAQKKY